MRKALFILFITLVACGSNSDFYQIGPGLEYKLMPAEKIATLNENIVDEFNAEYNDFDDVQLPLTKVVQKDVYTLYFSILTGMDYISKAEKKYAATRQKSDRNILKLAISDKAVQYVVEVSQYKLKYVLTIVGNENKIKELTENDQILERFKME